MNKVTTQKWQNDIYKALLALEDCIGTCPPVIKEITVSRHAFKCFLVSSSCPPNGLNLFDFQHDGSKRELRFAGILIKEGE